MTPIAHSFPFPRGHSLLVVLSCVSALSCGTSNESGGRAGSTGSGGSSSVGGSGANQQGGNGGASMDSGNCGAGCPTGGGSGGTTSGTGGMPSGSGGTGNVGADAGLDGDTGAPVEMTVPCSSPADCEPLGKICSFVKLECVDCWIETDCPAGQACFNYTCEEAIPCTSDVDCINAPGPKDICSSRNYCLECIETADCPTGLACYRNTCMCGDLDNDRYNCGGCGLYCADGCHLGHCVAVFQDTVLHLGDFPHCDAYCSSLGAECSTQCGGSGALRDITNFDNVYGDCTTEISDSVQCCCVFPPVSQ